MSDEDSKIFQKLVSTKLQEINARKESLIEAWVASTGIPPDQAALVHQNPHSTEERFWIETQTDRCMTHRSDIQGAQSRITSLERDLNHQTEMAAGFEAWSETFDKRWQEAERKLEIARCALKCIYRFTHDQQALEALKEIGESGDSP